MNQISECIRPINPRIYTAIIVSVYTVFCLNLEGKFAYSLSVVCSTDVSCMSANSLLEGRRRIVSTVFRDSNARSGYPASEARLNDDGWCSGLLATDIFDPYIEVDFGRDLILTSVITEGVPPNITASPTSIGDRLIERYRVEVAEKDGYLQYITLSANISQPAVSLYCVIIVWFYYVCLYTHRSSHWDRVGLVMPIDTQSHYLDQ